MRFAILLSLLCFSLASPAQHSRHSGAKSRSSLTLSSAAFPANGNIPEKFTCEGSNISPQISWKNSPSGTKTYAVVVHDPDAPHAGGYTHWVVYNIPANVNQIAENAPRQPQLPGGGVQGKNDDETLGYTGPCPPSGKHRYYFYLYALDTELDLQSGATAQDLDKAMEGHIVAKTQLMGRYKKGS